MITEGMIYWATRLDGIVAVCTAVAILSGMAALLAVMFGHMEEEHVAFRWATVAIVVMVVAACIAIFTPTTKQYAAIKIIPAIANQAEMGKIPAAAVEKLLDALDTKKK